MKKNFLMTVLMAALLSVSSSAMADKDKNPCGNSGNNCTIGGGSGGAGGQGRAGGSATGGMGIGIGGAGGNASAVNGPNTNTNSNLQGQTQGQGQQQGQWQIQSASSNQGQAQAVIGSGNSSQGQSTENANNSKQFTTVTIEGDKAQERNPVNTAFAPAIAPTAVCAIGFSGGAQGVGFGFSLGTSYIDKNCELLEQVRTAKAIGAHEVALEMMQDVPAFAAAAKRIADRKSGKVATVKTAEGYTKVDPFIAALTAK